MIRASLVCDFNGQFRSVEVVGHGGRGVRGSDPLCAAVSYATRTLYRTLKGEARIPVEAQFPDPGEFRLQVGVVPGDLLSWYQGVVSSFLVGMRDLVQEFPHNMILEQKQLED